MVLRKAVKSKNLDVLLERDDFLNPLSIGSWTPPVDKYQTESHVVVRVELPGVKSSDISISFRGEKLRIQGVKREPAPSRKFLCYYCLERRYGRFDRTLHIRWVIDPRRANAYLDKGILTIELPKLKDRRGENVNIRIAEK